jgi:hypothetical protein
MLIMVIVEGSRAVVNSSRAVVVCSLGSEDDERHDACSVRLLLELKLLLGDVGAETPLAIHLMDESLLLKDIHDALKGGSLVAFGATIGLKHQLLDVLGEITVDLYFVIYSIVAYSYDTDDWGCGSPSGCGVSHWFSSVAV